MKSEQNDKLGNMKWRILLLALMFLMFLISTQSMIYPLTNDDSNNSTANLSNYNQLLEQIENGNIQSITIYARGEIEGAFRANAGNIKKFKSNINPSLINDIQRKIDSAHKKPDNIFYLPEQGTPIGFLLLSSMLPFLLLIGFFAFFLRRTQNNNNLLTAFGKSKAKLASHLKKVTFEDVAGQDEAKEELREIIEFLKQPKKFQELGGKIPRGVLLVGPPGTGKTLVARAVAGEANVPFFSISGSDFVEMLVGVGASRVRDLFEQGKKNSPCILFMDEIDAIGRHRGTGLGGGHDEREQALNALLVEMDGFDSNDGVIMIAATNRPDILDPALLRPGRFDRKVILDKPDIRGRQQILEIHTRKIPHGKDVNLETIARGTPGLSGADLANLANEAALNAARNNRKTVTNEDFEFAKDKILMGGERRSMVISDEEKKITAVHEAGHTLVTIFTPKSDPLHKVTIIPRGMAMGLTQQLPEEDKHNYSKEYLIGKLAILMGGRCAEEIMLNGQQTTGASNDIGMATELARRMVCEWGMSNLGPQNFISKEDGLFLGKSLAEKSHNYSEETAQKIDAEVTRFITKAQETAKNIITQKIDTLHKLAAALIEYEVLDGDQVRQISFAKS